MNLKDRLAKLEQRYSSPERGLGFAIFPYDADEATKHAIIDAAIERFGGPVIVVPTKAPCS